MSDVASLLRRMDPDLGAEALDAFLSARAPGPLPPRSAEVLSATAEFLHLPEEIGAALRAWFEDILSRKDFAEALDLYVHNLIAGGRTKPWPAPKEGGPLAMIPAVACVLATPVLRDRYAKLGLPEHVLIDTLHDLTLWMEENRKEKGSFGLAEINWLRFHFAGEIFRLGRLQFAFERIKPDVRVTESPSGLLRVLDAKGVSLDVDATPANETFHEALPVGGEILGVHIPALGSLTEALCLESFGAAGTFFPRHFPDRPLPFAHCASWLLDPTLRKGLKASSNLLAFQRLFHLYRIPGAAEWEVWRRVFGGRPASLDEAPLDTELRRAVVAHAREGGLWVDGGGLRRISR